MDAITLAVLVAQAIAPAPELPFAPTAGPVVVERFLARSPEAEQARHDGLVPASQDPVIYSDFYYKRLAVHRVASYTILPLFAFQFTAGTKLYSQGASAPAWARNGHRVGATAIAALFTVNTVTGLWNLYDGRKDPVDRKRKVFHALMMLAAGAGFTATGLLAEDAEESGDDRSVHRAVALSSIGVATIGYLSMLDIFRRSTP